MGGEGYLQGDTLHVQMYYSLNAIEWKSTLLGAIYYGSLRLEWKSTLKIVESTPK